MKIMTALLAAALTGAASSASAEVVRHSGTPDAPILAGVTITEGSKLVLLSGQVSPRLDGTAAANDAASYGNTKTQAVAVFRKIQTLLAAQGLGLGDVVKLTVFLVGDPKQGGRLDFKGFSEAYAQFFGTPEQPNKTARSVVQVATLANLGFLVEIEAIAAR